MTHDSQSLGDILTGEITFSTEYEAFLLKNEFCKVLCTKEIKDFDFDVLKWMVEQEYVSNWFLDDLPAGRNLTMYGELTNLVLHDSGIPLGEKISYKENPVKIYNHYTFNIFINKDSKSNQYSIVEFSIVPFR